MSTKLNAFVPAAGIGERLRPITEHIPKPLLPVLGYSLLLRTLDRVSALPVERIGLNLHHKADAIASWVEASPFRDQVVLFHEDSLLGTGGALKNAQTLLGDGVFLVHNSDIVTDIDLNALVRVHAASGNIATLALHDYAAFNKVAVNGEGGIVGVGEIMVASGAIRILAFTGIAVYNAAFLAYLPEGASNVVDAWLAAVSDGKPVGSVDVTGGLWHDIGTPAAYAAAVVDALRRDGEWIYADNDVPPREVDLDGYVVVEEGSGLDDGAALRNAIVLPGARISRGQKYENCIVGQRFHVALSESEFLGLPVTEYGVQIGVGGSGRRYFRAWNNGETVVRMVCLPDEPDYERHIAYSRFFARQGVPVPKLLHVDAATKQATFEDLGDLSLYNYLRFPRRAPDIENIYRRVLTSLISLHVDASLHVNECELLANRLFDYDYFRWETTYFLERFVEGLCGQHSDSRDDLEREFDRLARQADALPKAIIHRDFQSQNIMITDGAPRFIDYQGARMAPPAYDVAAVLWDPYFRLDDAMRQRLVAYYIDLRKQRAGHAFSEHAFLESLVICRLQRHMQALGTYGFLAIEKGKDYFRKYIPEGLRLLKADVAETAEAYPAVAALLNKIQLVIDGTNL
ncbi:MAG: phosphotransferase [Candidatus Hydrogenedentes bacterium]|nr:phosphotransferase [Candidatus Hydrogenedentota bacterium]